MKLNPNLIVLLHEVSACLELLMFPKPDENEVIKNFESYGISHSEMKELFQNYSNFKEQVFKSIKEQELLEKFQPYIIFFQPFQTENNSIFSKFITLFSDFENIKTDDFEAMKESFFDLIASEYAKENAPSKKLTMAERIEMIQTFPLEHEEKWQLLNFLTLPFHKFLTIYSLCQEVANIILQHLPLMKQELNENEKLIQEEDAFRALLRNWIQSDSTLDAITAKYEVFISIFHFNSLALYEFELTNEKKQKYFRKPVLHLGCLFFKLNSLKNEKYEKRAKLINIFKALGDATRFEILQSLKNKKCYPQELARQLNLSPATLNHHFHMLSSLGLVNIELKLVDEKKIHYQLNKEQFIWLISELTELIGGNEDGKTN